MTTSLEKLTVVELASVLAGPSAGMFFAEMGATVIKIENKCAGGDVTRSWKLSSEDNDSPVSAYFSSVNWGKQHLFLDFNDPADLQQTIELICTADVVIVNFKKGDAEKFGLSFSQLQPLNHSLIYAEISGFGEHSDRVAYDLVLQAESGFMAMNGTENSGPVKMPVALIDLLAGHQLKEGILVALLQRNETGKGARVHVGLFDSAIASLANQASNWLMTGHLPARMGSMHPNIAPYGELFRTADGKEITLAIGSDRHFKKLCAELGLDDLAGNPDYSSNQARIKNRTKLAAILSEKISNHQSAELLGKLHAQWIPAAEIKDLQTVFRDPSASRLILEEDVNGVRTRRVKSVVFKIS